MTQISLHWDGASIGDANLLTVNAADGIGYRLSNANYESYFIDRMSRALWNGTGNRGVLINWTNELAVTRVDADTVSIDLGAAIIYGLFYENDTAAVTKDVTLPSNDTRYDRVVVRRYWATQTARIAVITGIEGGGIPDMIQSPAPSGSGIYDIPLATVQVDKTTGIPVAGITDDREYCAFPTGFADDAFDATHLAADSVDWTDRATRTKRLFLGGGDLEPNVNAGHFQYGNMGTYLTQVGPPVWGGAANEEAWRTTGASSDNRGLYITFRVPADYASGSIGTYVWWVNNAVVAATFYLRTTFQVWPDSNIVPRYGAGGSLTTTSASGGGAVSTVTRSTGVNIGTSGCTYLYATPTTCIISDSIIHYYVAFYNTAGAEDIGIMGIELVYTGYT